MIVWAARLTPRPLMRVALTVLILVATVALAGRLLREEPLLFSQALDPSVAPHVAGFATEATTLLVLAGGLLGAFVFTVGRKCTVGASFATLASVSCLYGKTYPSPIRPYTFAIDYARYAVGLGSLRDKFTANRWLPPWVAHWLGFRTPFGWLAFLLACYLMGTVVLYGAVRRRGGDPVWSLLVATIPAVTVTGWYGVSVPGYSDWVLYAVLVGAVFVRSWRVAMVLAALSLWVHERALFVVVLLPLLRSLLADSYRPREVLRSSLWLLVGIAAYFGLRGFVSDRSSGNLTHYLEQAKGHSIFEVHRRLGATLLGEAVLEAYKAVLLFPVVFVAFNLRHARRPSVRNFTRWGLLLAFVVIAAQVAVAVDTVRLMDLLVIPVVVAAILVYRQAPEHRGLLRVVLAGCLAVNLLTPLHYTSQNWNFHPRTRANLLCSLPWSCEAAMDLEVVPHCDAAPSRLVFRWTSAGSFDAQVLDLRLLGGEDITGFDAGLVRSPERSPDLDWNKPREWRVSTRWNGVWFPTEWQRVPMCPVDWR